MKLFDTKVRNHHTFPLASFDGKRNLISPPWGVYASFTKAKAKVKAELKDEIEELQGQLKALEAMTEDTCPVIDNPFD